ncbi:MAG TPA: dienelactone hydrolase family protein [Microthrixaceae bacterium]|nr:dienelactone hydrolase family protein [Microthrixaceae bacterium]
MATSGTAYLVQPDEGPGRGVLLLHSWWGLTRGVKDTVEWFADSGFTAMAPDLFDGAVPSTADEAREALLNTDPNVTADLILSSLVTLRAHSVNPEAPVGAIGFAMGASWALWAATRMPKDIGAVVTYYGTQNVDFEDLLAPVLAHFAEEDELVSDDDKVEMHARLLLSEKSIEIHNYEGTSHGFAEVNPSGRIDEAAAQVAWGRTIRFLEVNLDAG